MLPIEKYHDLLVAKLVEADHSNKHKVKDDLLQSLIRSDCQSSIFNSFIELDRLKFYYIYETIDEYLKTNENQISKAVNFIIQDILPPNTNKGLNRNSLYLSESGLLSSQLPSHYKFDRAVASMLKINPSLVNKDSLIVPKYSNTIRIYLDFAVLIYKPTTQQIRSLSKLDIKKYFILDQVVDSLFDPLIDKLPNYVSVQ